MEGEEKEEAAGAADEVAEAAAETEAAEEALR
jgi:hypothetical protein